MQVVISRKLPSLRRKRVANRVHPRWDLPLIRCAAGFLIAALLLPIFACSTHTYSDEFPPEKQAAFEGVVETVMLHEDIPGAVVGVWSKDKRWFRTMM
jgi:hypothetical protein